MQSGSGNNRLSALAIPFSTFKSQLRVLAELSSGQCIGREPAFPVTVSSKSPPLAHSRQFELCRTRLDAGVSADMLDVVA